MNPSQFARLVEAIPTAHVIEAFMDQLLSTEHYDEEEGASTWLDHPDSQCTQCTSSARVIASHFGGKVVGYQIEEGDSQTLVGSSSGGHDFAVVGPYVVDYWGLHVEETLPKGVFDRTDPSDSEAIKAYYKNESDWATL